MDDQKEKTEKADETKKTTEPTPDDIEAAAKALIDEGLIEEEPETKQPDEFILSATVEEAKNQTEKTETEEPITEATSKDSVDTLVEKTLAAEKMRPEIKTALVVLALTLLCIVYVYLMAFSDKYLTENVYLDTIFSTLIVGAVLAFFGAIPLTFSGKNYLKLFCIFFLISTIPAVAFIFPLSRYHNLNQIERDKKIVEVLKITVLEDGIEILLPSEYVSDNSYLEKVFSIGWERKNYPWKTTADYCQKGKKIWYEAELPFQSASQKGKEIVLYFNHAWYDYEITKEISFPDPNSL